MNELTLFNNPEFGTVRAVEIDGSAWLVGKEIAEKLEYINATKAIQVHVDEEDKKKLDFKGFSHFVSGLWGENDFSDKILINESGLYSLVLSSKMPKAKKFRRWVTQEVIPSIMRTGTYTMNDKAKPTNPNTEKRLAIQEMNAKTRQAKLLLDFAKLNLSAESKTLLANEAGKIITGKQILPLPETKRTYSASEVGAMFGVSANKIGRTANANGLKTDEYGITVLDTAPNGKQIPSFRYNDKAIDKFRELLAN